MKPVVFHDAAQAELDAAIAYYETKKAGLGLELLVEVEQVTIQIQSHPRAGSPYKSTQYRYVLVRRFPYVLYYLDCDDLIWIVAVMHAKRRPDYWRRRKVP